MATRLINAIGKGLGKTTTDAAKGTARRATRDVPSAKSFYNLGMGIGPFIRNTVQAYGQDVGSTAGDTKSAKANLEFAKENVVSQKNIAGQLSALTSIMSDIRKISLAQLNLQRASMPKGTKGFGDRSGYLSQEQMLESGRPSIAGSGPGGKEGGSLGSGGNLLGVLSNNPLLSAGLLGAVYLGFKKDIDRFMKDSGLSNLIGDLYDKVKKDLVTSVKEGISSIYTSIKTEFANAATNVKNDPTSAITPGTTLGGAVAGRFLAGKIPGLRKVPGFKLGATVLGGVLGNQEGASVEQLVRDANMEARTPEERAAKEAAKSKLTDMGLDLAGSAVSLYGAKRAYDLGKGLITGQPSPSVTPTSPLGGTPAPGKVAGPFDHLEGKKLTPYGTVGNNREMVKNKSVLQKAMGSLAEYAVKTKEMMAKIYAGLAKAVSKIGLQKVTAYIAMRAGVAASGLAGGPVVIVTTVLSIGWTAYDLYGFVTDLINDIEAEPSASQSTTTPTTTPAGSTPGANPTQPPAGSSPPSNPQTAGSDFANPLPSATGSKGRFGEDRGNGHLHKGVDISAAMGAPVLSVAEGEVIDIGDQGGGGLGKFVTIRHPNGMTSTYGHMSSIDVKQGDKLKKGHGIGKVGSTGKSDGPHLHIEMKNQAGDFVNPRDHIKGLPAYSGTDNRTNPEGSLKTIPGNGSTQGNISGSQSKAPGAGDLGSTFASAFGFDPSRMGVDLSKALSGDQIAKLNALQKEMGGGSAMIADAMNKINTPQHTKGPSQPSAPPAPGRTADNTQSKEKDHLWYYHNPLPPQYA